MHCCWGRRDFRDFRLSFVSFHLSREIIQKAYTLFNALWDNVLSFQLQFPNSTIFRLTLSVRLIRSNTLNYDNSTRFFFIFHQEFHANYHNFVSFWSVADDSHDVDTCDCMNDMRSYRKEPKAAISLEIHFGHVLFSHYLFRSLIVRNNKFE